MNTPLTRRRFFAIAALTAAGATAPFLLNRNRPTPLPAIGEPVIWKGIALGSGAELRLFGVDRKEAEILVNKVLAARLNDAQKREAQAKEAAERKSLIGSGDRSERIRTYNYPQGRVTDHRINLTLHKLDFVMDGDLEEITNALIAEHQAELLAAMGD